MVVNFEEMKYIKLNITLASSKALNNWQTVKLFLGDKFGPKLAGVLCGSKILSKKCLKYLNVNQQLSSSAATAMIQFREIVLNRE